MILPPDAPQAWQDHLTGDHGKAAGELYVRDVFKQLPLGLLQLKKNESGRAAGVLMHITSLPSDFGIGDLGPQAYAFADTLQRAHQTYWQLLPLNPAEAGSHYSPYSSFSSMAGNTLLISPEMLLKDGLLTEQDLDTYRLPVRDQAEFKEAARIRFDLLGTAWKNFRSGEETELHRAFYAFNRKEAYWLDEFALYVILKQHHQGEPWYRWEGRYKGRHADSLERFAGEHAEALLQVKWEQFLFNRQWDMLRRYCNDRGIRLFGDMPFYICHDSVDVWAHPGIFNLNDDDTIRGVAGVPPDFFNANGQLWGMPVFNWDVLKNQGYAWWVARLRRNRELFDLIRIDHFRAFCDYWEVPAGSETAAAGSWHNGPGADLFHAVREQLGELPFVAEDLGEITPGVHALRDELQLPGMKVLQFAYGHDANNANLPHFYPPDSVAYTGTHDNVTARGWLESLKPDYAAKISEYFHVNGDHSAWPIIRAALATVSRLAVIPMQDLLDLPAAATLNRPGTTEGNWQWRFTAAELAALRREKTATLRHWIDLYDRAGERPVKDFSEPPA